VDAAYHLWFDPGIPNDWLSTIRVVEAIQATGHVLYDFRTEGTVRPYAKVGCGVYWLKPTLLWPGRTGGEWHPYFGYNTGAGVNFHVAPTFDIGVGGTYHLVDVSGFDATLMTVQLNLLRRMGTP
jgi:opacity protein-like surface antigen